MFDETPHAWRKIEQWALRAMSSKASVPRHDKAARGAPLLAPLNFIERETSDERNFVTKDLSWA